DIFCNHWAPSRMLSWCSLQETTICVPKISRSLPNYESSVQTGCLPYTRLTALWQTHRLVPVLGIKPKPFGSMIVGVGSWQMYISMHWYTKNCLRYCGGVVFWEAMVMVRQSWPLACLVTRKATGGIQVMDWSGIPSLLRRHRTVRHCPICRGYWIKT